MGLAASQARLLSITSRLSDNELRTQLINNSKMRLATESSRVSEDYINALNSATMMMTNYDVNGNETTQALTFNTLTAYSPSNNQYGLVDTNGRILVSGKEANKFVQSGGNLDKFLELHDLKYTTSYFKGSTFGDWFDPAVAPNGVVNLKMEDADGNMVPYASYSPEELKAMYLGGSVMVDGMAKTYPSYEASQMSSEYYNYLEKYAKYDEEVSEYVDKYWTAFANGLNSKLDAVNFNVPTKTYNDVIRGGQSASNDPDIGTATNLTLYLNALQSAVADLTPVDSNFRNEIRQELGNYSIEGNHVYQKVVDAEDQATLMYDDGGRLRLLLLGQKPYKLNADGTYVEDANGKKVTVPVKFQGDGEAMLDPKQSNSNYQIIITDWAGTPGFNVNVYGIDEGVYISSGVTSNAGAGLEINSGTFGWSGTSYPTDLKTNGKDPRPITIVSVTGDVAKIQIGESGTTDNNDVDPEDAVTYYYVKLNRLYNNETNQYDYNISNKTIYTASTCSASDKADYGNQTWDKDTGTKGVEKYNSDHWANLQTFKYTNAKGELFVVTLDSAPSKDGKAGETKIGQTVKRAVLGDELVSIVEKIEERVRLEIIKEQELFNIVDAKKVMKNCGATEMDDAYDAALQKTVYEYLDSLFVTKDENGNVLTGRDANGNFVGEMYTDSEGNRRSKYQDLYETLWQDADKIGDIKWILKNYGTESNSELAKLLENNDTFNSLKSIGILEQLFDTFGEPKMGWVDTSDNNSDGTKKAEWYTNLFNKMKDGYKVLEQGLTGSKDWIQYALESGLATVVQVDKARNWTGAGYKNIKEITEVVDEKAVAVAEAQYNKAMNDIENKDKRFDMELKNIDTEHNALQQEYETIKSVISKNVERTFKYYS